MPSQQAVLYLSVYSRNIDCRIINPIAFSGCAKQPVFLLSLKWQDLAQVLPNLKMSSSAQRCDIIVSVYVGLWVGDNWA